MFESLFEFLFKYRPLIFEQGDFRFGALTPVSVAVVAAVAGAASTILTYRSVPGQLRARDRAVLAALRLGTLALVLVCLARPVLVLKAAVPQQNFLGILLDDSRSMRIADRNGEPRSAFIDATFGRPDSPVLAALSSRFVLALASFILLEGVGGARSAADQTPPCRASSARAGQDRRVRARAQRRPA